MAQVSIEDALNALRQTKPEELNEFMRKLPLGEVPRYEDQVNGVMKTLGGHLENLQGIRPYIPGSAQQQEEAPPKREPRPRRRAEDGQKYESRRYDQEELHVQPGDYIRVPRGILVETDAPGEKVVTTKRGKKVQVRNITPGSSTSPPTVVWYGSGGYRREADINDIEKL